MCVYGPVGHRKTTLRTEMCVIPTSLCDTTENPIVWVNIARPEPEHTGVPVGERQQVRLVTRLE